MNDFLAFAVCAVYVAFILWCAAAISRRVDRHYDRQEGER